MVNIMANNKEFELIHKNKDSKIQKDIKISLNDVSNLMIKFKDDFDFGKDNDRLRGLIIRTKETNKKYFKAKGEKIKITENNLKYLTGEISATFGRAVYDKNGDEKPIADKGQKEKLQAANSIAVAAKELVNNMTGNEAETSLVKLNKAVSEFKEKYPSEKAQKRSIPSRVKSIAKKFNPVNIINKLKGKINEPEIIISRPSEGLKPVIGGEDLEALLKTSSPVGGANKPGTIKTNKRLSSRSI